MLSSRGADPALEQQEVDKITRARAKRGKAPVYEKVRIHFDNICREPPTSPATTNRRRAQELTKLMLGHARQSIRSQPPLLDGMTVDQLTGEIAAFLAAHPEEKDQDMHRPLIDAQAVGRALHSGRGQRGWPALRQKALTKARAAADLATRLVEQQLAHDQPIMNQ